MVMKGVLWMTCATIIALVSGAGCQPSGSDGDGDVDTDADSDGDSDGDTGEECLPEWDCCSDSDCSDQVFCNGVEVCDRGRCEPDPDAICSGDTCVLVCDDELECTVDACDEQANTCTHSPDHAVCVDTDLCNGTERCEPTHEDADGRGCVAGRAMICDDGDDCTDDYCEGNVCLARLRDGDGDGHGDEDCEVCNPDDPEDCERGDDCDDTNETVYPGAPELCDDGEDNNCDRVRDYADPTCVVPNDTCAGATMMTEGEVIHGSTRGTVGDIDSSCATATYPDVAFSFTIVSDRDVEIQVDARGGRAVTVGLTSDCGTAAADLRCTSGREFTQMTRGLARGTYFVVVSSELETDFDISYSTSDPVERPEGDLCTSAVAIPRSGTYHGDTTDCDADYETRCGDPTHRDTTFTFTLREPQSLNLEISADTGQLSVALQSTCGVAGTERTCFASREGESASRYFRSLDAGTYYLVFKTPEPDTFSFEVTLGPAEPTDMEPWIDNTGHPALTLTGGSDDGQYNFNIAPLAFPFNETTFGCVAISTNGYLRFGPAGACPSATCYSDSCTDIEDLHRAGTPQVSYLGDDGYAGSSVTGYVDAAGNRVVITYLDYHRLSASDTNDIQIVLSCDTGDVQVSYRDCTFENTSYWHIGLSEPGVVGGTAQPHDFIGHAPGTVVSFGPGAIFQSPEHTGAAAYLPLSGRAIFYQRNGTGWDVLVDDLPL
jgi:hypothetical protein